MKQVKFIVFFILIIQSINLYSQDSKSKQDTKFEYFGFATLIKSYEKELEKTPDNNIIRHRLAISYSKIGQIERSLYHYNLIVLSGNSKMLTFEDWNTIAHYSLALGKVVDASRVFDKLSKINSHYSYQRRPLPNVYYEVKNVVKINTSYSDFSPVIVGKNLVFTSDRPLTPFIENKSEWTNTPYFSLFKNDTSNNKIELFSKSLTDGYHNGPASFTSDEKTIYFTKAFKESKTGLNTTKIYVSTLINGKWQKASPLTISQSNEFSVAHPVFIEKLNWLVFSSNMEGSLGGMDLFYCELTSNGWSKPINLGEKVNTPFNEVFPCYNKYDDNALYFSSNGHLGFGGLDVFKITIKDKKIATIELLPKSINSNYDDFGIAFKSPTKGYISSNRKNGKGADDIYSFELTNLITVSGIVLDDIKNNPLSNKKIYLLDEKGAIIDSVITNNEGFFIFTKLPYTSISLLPEDEDGIEMIIRPFDENFEKDPFTNLKLLSSKKTVLDSICLAQTEMVTYILESAANLKKRCAIYENGDKAVMIAFNVKNSQGNVVDQIVTDKEGCFIIKKLYPEKTYLELVDEENADLVVRFLDPKDEKNTNWLNEKTDVLLTSPQRCVVYEDGASAVQINFAVKDSTGEVIDLITTDEKGCFPIRKLYGKKTYLDLLEEEIAELGLRFVNSKDERNLNWQKDSNAIILRSFNKCVVYQNGQRAVRIDFQVKNDDGLILDSLSTDENGCFKVRKLYGNNTYLELIDEQNNTLKARLSTTGKDGIIILEKVETETNTVLSGKVFDMRKLDKDLSSLKIVFYSEGGLVQKVSTVNSIGEFTYSKLPSNSTLLMMIDDEEGVLQGSDKIKIKGEITPFKEFSKTQNDKNIYIVDKDQEKFTSFSLTSTGAFEIEIDVKLYEEASKTKETKAFDEIGLSKENQIIVKNIYFDRGKWNLNIEAEKIIDELVVVLRKYPDLKVNINAHTDCRGSASDNLKLSKNRAQSVSTYLLSKGIKPTQFVINGYGESKLLNHCKEDEDCTENEHAINRRIEFEFIWK
jgi:outer membrane protein OmpA-like peptidoglycan-associated protein